MSPFFYKKNTSSFLFKQNKFGSTHEMFFNFSDVARSGFFSKATEAKSGYELKARRQLTSFGKLKSNKKVNYKPMLGSDGEDSSQIVSQYKTNNLNKVTLRTATKRLSCFARRGNHPRRHNMFSKYIRNRAMNTKRLKKLPLSFYLPTFFNAATPFVRLKTRRQRSRRRRKKLFQKVSYRLRENGERQSYLLFSKRLQKSKKSTQTRLFREQIQTQRESLFIPKRRRKTKFDSVKILKNKAKLAQSTSTISNINTTTHAGSQSAVTSTGQFLTKNLRQIRDEIHKRAFRIKPRR